MINESTLSMYSKIGVGSLAGDEFGSEGLANHDLNSLIAARRRRLESMAAAESERERELSMYRSGSAPPTIEGSLSAVAAAAAAGLPELFGAENGDAILSEEDLRADPAYLSYYYSHVNLNPRLPPPVLSKEDWRSTQRLSTATGPTLGGIGDRRKTVGQSLFSQQPRFGGEEEGELVTERTPREWLDSGRDGLIGLSLGRQKSFADVLQENSGRRTPNMEFQNTLFDVPQSVESMEAPSSFHNDISSLNSKHFNGNSQKFVLGKSSSSAEVTSQSFATVLGPGPSTLDPQVVARTPSPGLPPVGVRMNPAEMVNNGSSSFRNLQSNAIEQADLLAALSSMDLSNVNEMNADVNKRQREAVCDPDGGNRFDRDSLLSEADITCLHPSSKSSFTDFSRNSGSERSSSVRLEGPHHKSPSASSNVSPGGSPGQYQNRDAMLMGYSFNPTTLPSSQTMLNYVVSGSMPPLFESAAAAAAAGGNLYAGSTLPELQNSSRFVSQGASPLPAHLTDPQYLQYLKAAQLTGQTGTTPYTDLAAIQNAYIEALLQIQKQSALSKAVANHHGFYGNPTAFTAGLSYPGSPVASPTAPGGGSLGRLDDRKFRFPAGLKNLSWRGDFTGFMTDAFPPSLLDEFKSNKTRCFELAEIAGHVVEFSADQYGSRFIQQKLETATAEEKNMVYDEIIPHVHSLMTDVFGNYVVQKLFEHGSSTQRWELAEKLFGHVLALSLQMYGCRVIQKAIEVVDLNQKKKMVTELDGHVMKCVHDQNGNHVIQKCIECIPQDSIQFIISTFYGQIVQLSTHPYGCRVIQRVLEYCSDEKTEQIVMDEILQSVCMLAQDQYGNYVIQHVLEHGKPHERSIIIGKLSGQIVQMSQQKFASNVIEKCLTFGSLAERQGLIAEILGTTDENEPLQAMMKDQFGNYVVQKVLETCDDQQREMILNRIKVHLNALKKYTYGKHIVARVEKLVAAGERRIGMQVQYAAS